MVEKVLAEIGAGGKPMINAYNKCDAAGEFIAPASSVSENVYISAKTGMGIDKLIDAVARTAPGAKTECRLLIPYSDGGLLNELHTREKVLSEEYTGSGIMIKVLLDAAARGRLKKYTV